MNVTFHSLTGQQKAPQGVLGQEGKAKCFPPSKAPKYESDKRDIARRTSYYFATIHFFKGVRMPKTPLLKAQPTLPYNLILPCLSRYAVPQAKG